jgi:hypothetical protein
MRVVSHNRLHAAIYFQLNRYVLDIKQQIIVDIRKLIAHNALTVSTTQRKQEIAKMNTEYREGFLNGTIEDCPYMLSSNAARAWICGAISNKKGLAVNYKCKPSRGHTMKVTSPNSAQWLFDFTKEEKRPEVTRLY